MSKIDFSAHEQWWNIAKYIYSNSVLVHNIEILVDYCGGKYRTSYSLLEVSKTQKYSVNYYVWHKRKAAYPHTWVAGRGEFVANLKKCINDCLIFKIVASQFPGR